MTEGFPLSNARKSKRLPPAGTTYPACGHPFQETWKGKMAGG